jgi:hypothetical protein
VRHLAVAADGTIVSGQQYEGEPQDVAPLLAIKRPGQAFQPFPVGEAQRATMNQYTASLAIHDELRLLALTAPRGNRFLIWNLDSTELLLDAPLPDCAGVAVCMTAAVRRSPYARWNCLPGSGTTICAWPEPPAQRRKPRLKPQDQPHSADLY